jgi:hypothetical protein
MNLRPIISCISGEQLAAGRARAFNPYVLSHLFYTARRHGHALLLHPPAPKQKHTHTRAYLNIYREMYTAPPPGIPRIEPQVGKKDCGSDNAALMELGDNTSLMQLPALSPSPSPSPSPAPCNLSLPSHAAGPHPFLAVAAQAGWRDGEGGAGEEGGGSPRGKRRRRGKDAVEVRAEERWQGLQALEANCMKERTPGSGERAGAMVGEEDEVPWPIASTFGLSVDPAYLRRAGRVGGWGDAYAPYALEEGVREELTVPKSAPFELVLVGFPEVCFCG